MVIQKQIEEKLTTQFEPEFLQVRNESDGHNVPKGSETHFKVVIVSTRFEGLSVVKRQQLVYATLQAELAGEVHALSMQTYLPTEWHEDLAIPDSPPCLGGSGKK